MPAEDGAGKEQDWTTDSGDSTGTEQTWQTLAEVRNASGKDRRGNKEHENRTGLRQRIAENAGNMASLSDSDRSINQATRRTLNAAAAASRLAVNGVVSRAADAPEAVWQNAMA